MFNKKMLQEKMKAFGDKHKDLTAALGMAKQNFSAIWHGRQEFRVSHIRIIAERYSLTPQEVWDIFLFPDPAECPATGAVL